jgi:uncharacterized protein (TIGR03435 family)
MFFRLIFLAAVTTTLVSSQSFDVASIKPVTADQYGRLGREFDVKPNGLHVQNLEVMSLVREAYNLKGYQVSGGPVWLTSDTFNVDAKTAEPHNRAEIMQMLQSLLAGRFQMKVRMEERDGKIFYLTAADKPPNIKPTLSTGRAAVRIYRKDPPEQRGVNYALVGERATMAMLCGELEAQMQRPVIDHTGLTGEYDFKVDYVVEQVGAAVQSQLGFKLEPARGPVRTLVIEHAERPSAN